VTTAGRRLPFDASNQDDMISSRVVFLSVLSISCVFAFLYYTIIPRGPQLLLGKPALEVEEDNGGASWKSTLGTETDDTVDTETDHSMVINKTTGAPSEMFTTAEKFTPE